MEAMNLQDDMLSIPFGNFKHHCVLVFDLTSMQDATEECHFPEQVGAPLKLELNLSFLPEYVSEFIVLGQPISSVAVEKFGAVGKHL